MNVIRNLTQVKNILKKMSVENNFDLNNVLINRDYKYIETFDCNLKDADFCKTEYKGVTYKVQYISGCFNPFIVEYNKNN